MEYANIAFDFNNVPYIAYMDSYLDAKIVVSKFTGGKWTTVGGGPLSDESCLYARLALDGEDKPWVIYQDGAQKEKSTVKKLNAAGTGWSLVGTAGFSKGPVLYTNIQFDSGGSNPYVAFSDDATDSGSAPGKVSVYQWDDKTWAPIGTSRFTEAGVAYVNLQVDAEDNPWIAFVRGSSAPGAAKKASVMQWTGSKWQQIGAVGVSEGQADYLSFALDRTLLMPYIAYQDLGFGNRLSIMAWDSDTNLWSYVGRRGISEPVGTTCSSNDGNCQVEFPSMRITNGGVPVVAYSDKGTPCKPFEDADLGAISVLRFNGTLWQYLGGRCAPKEPAYDLQLGVSWEDELYLFQTHGEDYRGIVWKLS